MFKANANTLIYHFEFELDMMISAFLVEDDGCCTLFSFGPVSKIDRSINFFTIPRLFKTYT